MALNHGQALQYDSAGCLLPMSGGLPQPHIQAVSDESVSVGDDNHGPVLMK